MAVNTATMRENPDVKELLELLKSPGFQAHRQSYESLLNGVDSIIRQYDNILTELDALKEKVSRITDRKNPLAVMVGRLEALADNIEKRLNGIRDGIITFTKNALNTVKEKGLSALGSVFRFLHVKDGLQAMSNGLAKSVESLNNAVARVNSLEQHNREKAAAAGNAEAAPTTKAAPPLPAEAQAVSLSEMLADMRVDFENLTPDELKATYDKLLEIGKDNDLTANELTCLQYLTDEAEALLPGRGDGEQAQVLEHEYAEEQGEEI